MSFFETPAFHQSAALLAAATDAPAALPFYQSPGFINSAIFLGLIIVSALVGNWLARALRSIDYGAKFSIILFAILASAVVIYRGWPPRLGIDLGGGSILVYKVDTEKRVWRPEMMDDLLVAIGKRVNPGGVKEISVRSLGTDMVQIAMPSVSGSTKQEKQAEAEEIRKIVRTTGALEFRIVACNRDDASLIERAKVERKKFPVDYNKTVIVTDPKRIDPATGKPRELGKWCRVRDAEVGKLKDLDAVLDVGSYLTKDADGKEVEKERWEVFVLSPANENRDVTGKDVHDARTSQDSETGMPEVAFSFNSEGGVKFGKLTGEHVPQPDGFKYHLAIVLDDVLITAPYINSIITDNGRITGDFELKEVTEIVGFINAGSSPAALEPTPVRDMTTDATLGADTIRQSTWAMAIAAIAVPLFMIYYYRFAGVVAVLVLGLNMLMLVALMILIKAPFTLPALAGLALTVGMAVDNNVLIYERLREELHHGAALRMAIRNSFHRVGVVIIDANITHLIAATVLWSVGTEQVKGFAVTFWLGAVLSIWATMFVARVLFEVSERRRWLTKMNMVEWIGHTKIDFMAWFPACATFSAIITVLGIVIAGVRGQGLFDIDFTGGVSVQTVFQKVQDIKDIREKVESRQEDLKDATVTPAQSSDEPKDQRFIIDTSNSSGEAVADILKKLFGSELVSLELVAKPIVAEKPASNYDEKKPEKPAATEEKPSEPPIDMTKPKAGEPKAAEPPKSAEPKASAPKAVEPPPAAKPASSVKPADIKTKQSRIDLPAWSLVAMAGPEAVLLVMADDPAAKTTGDVKPTPKTDAKPEAAKPAAKSETKPEAKPETKTETKPEAKAETKPVAAPVSKLPATAAAEKPEAAMPKTDSPPPGAAADSSFEATLTLSSTVPKLNKNLEPITEEQNVKYDDDHLRKLIEQAVAENKFDPMRRIELTRKETLDAADKTTKYSWTAKLVPDPSAKHPLTKEGFRKVLDSLEADVRALPYFPIVDNIGSAVANDTRFWAVVALVSSWSLIILYLWVRFQGVAFGVAAVIALIHDVLVMLGAIAFSSYLAQIPGFSTVTMIEPFKINLPIVAAFLTIIGYSVNDTIVVFDRIREIRGKSPTLTRQMVNDATNQTLSRTVLTSFTVMLVVFILYIFGGQAVHGFAFALIIGVLTGTYSSIYVAAPILLWLLHPKEMSVATSSSGSGKSTGKR